MMAEQPVAEQPVAEQPVAEQPVAEQPVASQPSPLKQALVELRTLRTRLEQVERRQHEPVAIVGLGLRLPGGVRDAAGFWDLLRSGGEAITEVPADRWNLDELYDPDPLAPGKVATRFGGFLDHIDEFAPEFFGISPREAASMDPQQRLLLEVTWEALERSGHAPSSLFDSRTGVFVGISTSDHLGMLLSDPDAIDAYVSTGNALSLAAGRLAYVLGLRGPNLALDTACSSSLVAIHLACQSLRRGESDFALAGGASLMLSPALTINFSRAQMLARDGRCKTFDASADGYVRSEGCGMVVLRRLTDALADGDPILAIIRGTAINQDGRSGGLTAPNGPAQEAVIRAALEDGGVRACDVDYVEAHGTGTPLGDPIEVGALRAALAAERPAGRPLQIGSVKTNVGHLEAAAGIAGLAKVILALQHAEIPPHLHLQHLNPHIQLKAGEIEIPTTLRDWPTTANKPRLAGVSSFGLSGTNAHIVVEAAPMPSPTATASPQTPLGEVSCPRSRAAERYVLPLSARTAVELRLLAAQYAALLAYPKPDPHWLVDVCYTAGVGRNHFAHRLVVNGSNAAALYGQLRDFLAAGDEPSAAIAGTATEPPSEIAFLFTGHGSTYVDMGRRLHATEPVFRAALERCAELAAPLLEHPLLAALFPSDYPEIPGAVDLLARMSYAQPALFALQVALTEQWRTWGIRPNVVLGHSAGEYAAAWLAGIFNLADGLKLAAARGRLLESLASAGRMVACRTSEERVRGVIAAYAQSVSVAAINGPDSVVISGKAEDVEAAVVCLATAGIEYRRLDIATASHSPLVDPILDEFECVANDVAYALPTTELVSTLTGGPIADHAASRAGYWRDHLRQPVQFAAAMDSLASEKVSTFVEIGPAPTLLGMGARCLPEGAGVWLPSLRPGQDEVEQLASTLAELYVRGADVDWGGVAADPHVQRIELPTYQWVRERHWIAPGPTSTPAPARTRWPAITAAGVRQAQQGPFDLDPREYPRRWAALDRLATGYIARALRADLGLFGVAGEEWSLEELMTVRGIQPTYRHLMARWLAHLVSDGALTQRGAGDDQRFGCLSPLPTIDLGELESSAAAELTGLEPLVVYLQRCGRVLAAVVTGQESPLETLFPAGAYDTVDFLYRDWAVSRYFNALVGGVVGALDQSQGRRPLRVLEIGAGTGGTSSAVLPIVAAAGDNATYTFTDVSEFFLQRAAARFAEFPCVEYCLFDAERDPAEQGLRVGTYDAVIAANALHATAHLDNALRHARALLAPGGVLVLLEGTARPRWLDVSTGLIAGWQKFEDDWRTDSPLLDPETWSRALQANGFDAVLALPTADSAAAALNQHVVVARAGDQPAADVSFAAWPAQAPGQAALHAPSRVPAVTPRDARHGLQSEVLAQVLDVPAAERRDAVVGVVRRAVARVLGQRDAHVLGREARLMDLGLDSLMAVELRDRLATTLGLTARLPATLIFDHPTIDALTTYLEPLVFGPSASEEIGPVTRVGSKDSIDAEAPPDIVCEAQLAELSDAEVEALLLRNLQQL